MSEPDFDPYAVLGVPRTATSEEIRTAYRALVAKYHPDRHQGNPLEELAAARLAEINRAYEILGDAERRAVCDAGPSVGPSGSRVRASGGTRLGRWLGLLGLLLILPLLVRLVVFLARTGAEGFAAVRGTPLLLALLVLFVAAAIVLLVRRRRR